MRRLATVIGTLAVAAGAGCGGGGGQGGRGGQSGQAGGFTGFGGFGLFDGGGLSDGGGSSGTDGPPLQPAPPICGNGIVEAAEACDVAATSGCGATQRCSATCTCVAGPPAPTDSRSLIAQALADGRIDYFTSLLYRAQLFVGDGRLPPEYDGDFTVDEDTALFLEVSSVWSTLTSPQQQQILPYVVRPNDPASIYSRQPTAASFYDDLFAPGDSDPLNCPPAPGNPNAADMRYTTSNHFVVWSCGTGNPATDTFAAKRQAVSALAEQVWALEVPTMGAPRNDDFPFDPDNMNRIDIYLVPLNKCIVRPPGTLCNALKTRTTRAAAPPDSPCDNSRGALTSSGYILMRLDLVPDTAPAAGAPSQARSDFAHEFFHLLTWGLNLDAQGGRCRGGQFTGAVAGRTSWLTEASATWAEWAYTPTDNPQYRADQFSSYQQRVPFKDSLLDNSIDPNQGNPAYEAFTYPLFLSQKSGNRMSFEDFWKTARNPRTREALDDFINTRFSFERHFRDFAVKMLNLSEPLRPGDPIAPLLSAFDSAVPPEFKPLNMLPEVELPPLINDTDLPFKVDLAPLAAQYQEFTVPPDTRWVDVDLSGAGADMTMDAIVNVRGTWSRREANGLRFTFCRDDAADDISSFTLVIANVAHRAGAQAKADYKVKTRSVCPGSLTGWMRSENTLTKHHVDGLDTIDQYEQERSTWTLGAERMVSPGGGVLIPGIDASWHGQFIHHETVFRTGCQFTTHDGEGGGSDVTPLAVMELPGGMLVLAPVSADPNSYDVEMVTHYEMCDGNNLTTNQKRTVYDGAGVVSGLVQLTPSPGNPNRYVGSKVVTHSEQPLNGGMSVVDFKVSWDITRNRR